MKKQILLKSILIIFLIVSLCGCNNNNSESDKNKITGTWIFNYEFEGSNITAKYDFLSDEAFSITTSYRDEQFTISGTWKILDNKLVINAEDATVTYDYSFLNNNQTLEITDEEGKTSALTRL
jgi:uncharacterized lipoprotein NlpE involved in copper resistance